jgi:hypothetical protein
MKILTKFLLFLFLIVATGHLLGQAPGRCGNIDRTSVSAIKKEVVRVFNETLDRMETTSPQGFKTATWTGWKADDEGQIRCLGTSAVRFIVELLDSPRSFGQLLAVKMLGWAGGSEIIAPLARVLQQSKSQTVKISALESLYAAPQAHARPVLENIVKSTDDSRVREKANEILRRYKSDQPKH